MCKTELEDAPVSPMTRLCWSPGAVGGTWIESELEYADGYDEEDEIETFVQLEPTQR